MKISGRKTKIMGMIEKNDNYYVIRDKEDYTFVQEDGNVCYSIMDAEWYRSYKDAKNNLELFDEPERFDIILISCLIKLEEIM